MIPYDDIPDFLLLTHPRHKAASQLQGGREFTQKWNPAWVPFVRTELEAGRLPREIANELNITAETLRKHMHSIEAGDE